MSIMNIHEERKARIIGEQAAEWLLILEDGQSSDREAFSEWLKKSPLHIEAFLRAAAMDALLSRVDPERAIEIQRHAQGEQMPDITPDTVLDKNQPGRRSWLSLPWAAAAAVVLVAAVSLVWWQTDGLQSLSTQEFHTGIGEQRVLELDDGSVLHLNTSSTVRVAFNRENRRVDLLAGEALFRVHRDPHRPFKVYSANAVIQAVGTQFNVYRRQNDAVVSVIEGAVQISNERKLLNPPLAPVRVDSGEQVHIGPTGSVSAKAAVDVSRVNAWRQRRLVFKDEPLSDIAEEFNRYNRTPKIRIDGAEAGERRYAAAFDADDPESLLTILRRDSTFEVQQRPGEIVIRLRPKLKN